MSFPYFLLGNAIQTKKYEFSLSLRSAKVLFFFFAYRSAEGDERVFESSLLLVLFLLKEEREKKILVIE